MNKKGFGQGCFCLFRPKKKWSILKLYFQQAGFFLVVLIVIYSRLQGNLVHCKCQFPLKYSSLFSFITTCFQLALKPGFMEQTRITTSLALRFLKTFTTTTSIYTLSLSPAHLTNQPSLFLLLLLIWRYRASLFPSPCLDACTRKGRGKEGGDGAGRDRHVALRWGERGEGFM